MSKNSKKNDMPAPQPKKKRKSKEQPSKINQITNYFPGKGSLLTQPKHDDEQKLDSFSENFNPAAMDICDEIRLSQPFVMSTQLSFCPESEDADLSQSESTDWLRTSHATWNSQQNLRRKASDPPQQVFEKPTTMMRALSLDSSSQSYLTPSDQPVHMPTSMEMDQALQENRLGRILETGPTEPPGPCAVNPYLPLREQSSTIREINLYGSGKYFREYKQEKKEGKGSFGEVFKCRHRFDGCIYAVKRLKMATHLESVEQLKKEAFIMSSFANDKCPNLIQYFGSWVENGDVYIAMEYVPNGSLASRLGQPMDDETLIDIFLQIGDALQALHKRLIVHLDVKPSNILITEDHHLKLTDFGSAAKLDVEDHMMEGDRRYVSPELLDQSYSRHQLDKTDIFSLGATVYEMQLGEPLPEDGWEFELLRTPEFKWNGNVGDDVKTLIQATMNPDCDSRPKAEVLVQMIREERSQIRQLTRRLEEQSRLLEEKNAEVENLRSQLMRHGISS